jgi:predicted Zn-ribbon and HTH transcriptional regulator
MPKYNPDKNMKLSSFLQMRVDRRLINELRDKSRKSKNATLLNIVTYNVTCDCGYNFVSTVNKDDMPRCPECGKYVSTEAKKLPVTIFEVNESMARYDDGGSETNASMYERIPDESVQIEDDVIYSYDMNKWLQNEDPRVVKIINLMYFHDYSITAAAKEVGLTGAGANIKLKDLRNNRIVREIFGR